MIFDASSFLNDIKTIYANYKKSSQQIKYVDLVIKYCGVEQLVARRAHNPEVAGSSPVPATMNIKQKMINHIRKITKNPNADLWTLEFNDKQDIINIQNPKNRI